MIKSKNNKKCISDCYPKNTIVIHPLTLVPFSLKTKSFCLIDPWVDDDGDVHFGDICDEKHIKTSQNINYDIMVVPNITINSTSFLNSIYNIYTLEEAIKYIDINEHLPYDTKNRLLNCIWQTFYEEIRLNKDFIINLYKNFSKNWTDIEDNNKIKNAINFAYSEIIKNYGAKSKNILYNDKFKKYFKINISK